MAILITGGAGFVGSNIAKLLKSNFPKEKIICFDNLKRRGSETNLATFKELEIDYIHGDIRHLSDLESIEDEITLVIEASAEPSVHAGINEGVDYLLETNLWGTKNCLEFIRKRHAKMIFLSTSRVYSINDLTNISFDSSETRFMVSKNNRMQGLTDLGISESFNTLSHRSLYGTSKLCSELLIQEYIELFNLDIIINRCGVITGPGQWGKVDQGVFTLWVANHYFNRPLKYTGFGGKGFQVRDLLHPKDLFAMIKKQMENMSSFVGSPINLGGGVDVSTSLLELTKICEDVTGNKINMGSVNETASVDIPYYVTDISYYKSLGGIPPKHSIKDIVSDIYDWISQNEDIIKPLFT